MYIDKHRHNCIIETKDTELNVVLHACNHSKLGSRDRRVKGLRTREKDGLARSACYCKGSIIGSQYTE